MMYDDTTQEVLKQLPKVDSILKRIELLPDFNTYPRTLIVRCIRQVIDAKRQQLLTSQYPVESASYSEDTIYYAIQEKIKQSILPNLRRTINATGVVVHTNLGRSLLSNDAMTHVMDIAKHYSNLEFDIQAGTRGSRYSNVDSIICELTGAEAAMVVNNNAAAVLLCLQTLAYGKEVIISRGELVEIGGSFRMPDVMVKSGVILKEVGTTNKTHLNDYVQAISSESGLFLKVHTSNYAIVGFTSDVSLDKLVKIAHHHHIPVMIDLGSGVFIDLTKYGLPKETTVQETVSTGVDIVTFSGDKLLGGPQAGIIVGQKKYIDAIKKNPLTRALRIDKLTLAALEITLRAYYDENTATQTIPTLRMLLQPIETIKDRAMNLLSFMIDNRTSQFDVSCINRTSKVGGGALPIHEIDSYCVAISHRTISENDIQKLFRQGNPSIIGRIEDGMFLIDLRTVQEQDLPDIKDCFKKIVLMNTI